MTPTPPSTSSSVGGHSPEGQYRVVRKRNRVPLSCAPCRQRKLKCNRSHPCENCVKRGDASSCTYAQPGSRKKSSPQNSSTSPDDMQNRIDRLENLVLSLMTNGSQAAGPAAAAAALSRHDSLESGQNYQDLELDDDTNEQNEESDTEAVTKSFGIMKVDNNKSIYISEAHWASILNDIAEVRQFFQSSRKQYEEQAQKIQASNPEADTTTMLLFGSVKAPTKSEILASFPSRYITDMLIARFFNNRSHGPGSYIIHVPTFQKDYNEHWKDPSASCPVWIGMLYAIMRQAMLSYYHDGEEPPEFKNKSLDMSKSFRHLMCQCLILADYTKPYPYLIETLVLHMHADFIETNDANIRVWLLCGIIARLALRMGYHRDSKMFPNISPFQGEMRRRVWAVLVQADLLFSFQVGMPSMLRPGDTDTELPRNLYDEDFGPDSKEIPPDRPMEQKTPVSYMIAKSRLSMGFGRVIEHASLVRNAPYEVVIEIDADLRRARDLVPDHLRVLSFEERTGESTDAVLMRYYVESIYHKAQVVLHRRYIGRARENPRFTHSRRTCIDSALELLRYQAIFHNQKLPSGRLLSKVRDNAISNSNYLLSATVICLDLYQSMQLQAAGRPSGDVYIWGRERRDEMLAAIQQARDIWRDQSDESMESWKAAGMMTVMLEKLNMRPTPGADMNGNTGMLEVPDEKQSAAMTLGLLSSGMSPQDTGTTFTDPFKNTDSVLSPSALAGGATDMGFSSPFNMLGQMPDMQLDWNAWDSYIGNPTLDNNSNALWPMFDMPSQVISPMGTSSSGGQPTPSTNTNGTGTGTNGTPGSSGNRSASSVENIRNRIRMPGVLPSDTGTGYSALRPAARRLLSVRPNVSLINARSRSITTQSIALSRPAATSSISSFQRIQRRWNSDQQAAKDAATKAETTEEIKAEEREPSLESALEAAAMEAAKEQGSTINANNAQVEVEVESTEQGAIENTAEPKFEIESTTTEQVSAAEAQGVITEQADGPKFMSPRGSSIRKRNENAAPSPCVFVGNIFFDVTAEDLKARMEEYGVVEKATIISDARGLSKGFGYVTFDSTEAAQSAIDGMNQNIFEGRRVIVQFAAAGPRGTRTRSSGPPTRSLYIGNLAYDLSDRELNDLFKSVRNVIEVRVAVDRQTGNPRGFAHADFLDVASAQAAFEILAGKAPHGRRLKIDYSQGSKRTNRRSAENDGTEEQAGLDAPN